LPNKLHKKISLKHSHNELTDSYMILVSRMSVAMIVASCDPIFSYTVSVIKANSRQVLRLKQASLIN